MTIVRFKVCCIKSAEEAALAVELGASALGFVGPMPSGAGIADEALIAAVAPTVPPGVDTFLLTSAQDVPTIVAQVRAAGTSCVQLVDHVDGAGHEAIRAELPGTRVVQVIHVVDDHSVTEAEQAAKTADALLLDSGNPNLEVKELGGTGRVHDWALSTRIVEAVAPTPVYLAGGLTPANVAQAIAAVRPFGVDVCSKLRSGEDFDLDRSKTAAFAQAVAGAGD